MQFKDIVGQKDTKHDLIQSFKSDKISHAQLFLGKPGYGTLALALAYSQYIFCENKFLGLISVREHKCVKKY